MSNFNWKSLSDEELQIIFEEVNFKIDPWRHQKIAIAFTLNRKVPRALYLFDVGTGKTIAALLTLSLLGCKKILVVCPTSAFGAWERDIPATTDYNFTFLTGSKQERLNKLSEKYNIYVINYEGLKVIYSVLITGYHWVINPKSFVHNFDAIVFDEVHKCRAPKSLQSRICFELSRRSKCCLGLTGTILDKNLLELHNVYKVVDLGSSLGSNYFSFRRSYFRKGKFEWYPKQGSKEKILSKVAPISIRFSRDECLDLPEIQSEIKEVSPSLEFLNLQDQIINKNTLTINKNLQMDNPEGPARSVKLVEISGGFFYYRERTEEPNVDPSWKRKAYRLKRNPKLETLMDIIDESSSKVVVFHNYIEESLMIEEELEKSKIGYISVRGGTQKNRKELLNLFTNDPKIKILLAHPSCAREGFDASISNLMIFFSPIASPMIREQCMGRIYRAGQTKKCLFIDLVMKDSVDATILNNRSSRKRLVDSVMEYIQKYKTSLKKSQPLLYD